ncbi:hypothetical protein NADE_008198 [Nannochloris sp. 'desiccata']|nr:hypothetical protein NADE_008198 [Chlorella desiccata (nom. nud.)]
MADAAATSTIPAVLLKFCGSVAIQALHCRLAMMCKCRLRKKFARSRKLLPQEGRNEQRPRQAQLSAVIGGVGNIPGGGRAGAGPSGVRSSDAGLSITG